MDFENAGPTFLLGERVHISRNHHWGQGALGTIAQPPEYVKQLVKDLAPWVDWHRYVQGVDGQIKFYWVNFDDPQFDADGDGPYRGGEIRADVLERLS